jgi:hypothetical protein
MSKKQPPVTICRYQVKPGKEAEMERLLAIHWPTLHKAGLVTDEPARVFRGLPSEKDGGTHGAKSVYIELMSWKDENSSNVAHQSPEVMSVWEPMGGLCEQMDFPSFEELHLPAPKK